MNETQSIVTIQDVAARAGVSAMTVSRVLNSPARVAPATRQRVEQVIHDLGYVPNALATGLLKGRTRTIALIVSDIGNPFFTIVMRGVEDLAQRNGYTVILGNSDESVEKERKYVTALMSKRIDGLLIAPAGSASRATLDALSRRGSPFVLIDRDIEGITADSVTGDNISGAKMLTRHLLQLGHRRIGLVNGPPDVPTARDRRRGYEEALREHGIASDPALIMESNYQRHGGYRSMQQLLALPPDQWPTAIFACNNFLAVGAVEALREAQLTVPHDMALVCFDDIELASALDPFLTVVAQPARSFGTIAAQFLFERIDGDAGQQPRRVVLTPELIVRRSCGAQLGQRAPIGLSHGIMPEPALPSGAGA
jgi:LacI family transcriptional regulator